MTKGTTRSVFGSWEIEGKFREMGIKETELERRKSSVPRKRERRESNDNDRGVSPDGKGWVRFVGRG